MNRPNTPNTATIALFEVLGRFIGSLYWVAVLVVVACGSASGPGEPLDDGRAYFPAQQWRTASPSQLGMDGGRVDALLRDAGNGRWGTLHGLIVIKNGYVVVERYWNWDPNRAHTMQSVTKSITSLVFGVMHDRQPAQFSLDRTVLDAVPRYAAGVANLDSYKQALTLRHLLSMRTGMNFYEQPYAGSPLDQLNRSADDWVQRVLDTPMRGVPGTTWAYNSGAPILLCGIIREVAGEGADAVLARDILQPIGASTYNWYRSPFDGLPHCGGGFNMRAIDLARIGYLVLRNGRWGNRQIISQSWLAESTSPVSSAPGLIFDAFNPSYGYYWWGFPSLRGGQVRDIITASGAGGQWLFVIPSLDVVAVVIAENGDGLDLLYDGLLPAAR